MFNRGGRWAETQTKEVMIELDSKEGKYGNHKKKKRGKKKEKRLYSIGCNQEGATERIHAWEKSPLIFLPLCRPLPSPLPLPLPSDADSLKLLVELSYGGLYTKRTWDGPTLSPTILAKLIAVANMFEFNDCIEACCEELKQGLDRDNNAIGVIDACAGIEPLPKVISDVIDAAVVAMGPLEKLWSQGQYFCSHVGEATRKAGAEKLNVST